MNISKLKSRFIQSKYDKKNNEPWVIFEAKDANYLMELKTFVVCVFYELKLSGIKYGNIIKCDGYYKDKNGKFVKTLKLTNLGEFAYQERWDLYQEYIKVINQLNSNQEHLIKKWYYNEIANFSTKNRGEVANSCNVKLLDKMISQEIENCKNDEITQ